MKPSSSPVRILLGLVAILAVAAGLMLYSVNRPPQGAAQPGHKITLAQNTVPLSTLTIIAESKGFFSKRGLDVTVKPFASGKLALDAVLGGGADIATVAETPLARTQLAGVPVATVANIAYSTNDIKVAYRAGQGITAPADLRGKTISTAVGTSAEYFTDVFLSKYGMTPADVKIINLAPAQMVQALSSGDISAFIIWEPYPHTAQVTLGKDIGIFEDDGLYRETFNIAVTPGALLKNKEALQNFLLALTDAEMFVKTSPAEAMDIVSAETNLDRATLEAIWPQFTFQVSDPTIIADILQKERAWVSSTTPGSTDPASVPEIIDSSIFKSTQH